MLIGVGDAETTPDAVRTEDGFGAKRKGVARSGETSKKKSVGPLSAWMAESRVIYE